MSSLLRRDQVVAVARWVYSARFRFTAPRPASPLLPETGIRRKGPRRTPRLCTHTWAFGRVRGVVLLKSEAPERRRP